MSKWGFMPHCQAAALRWVHQWTEDRLDDDADDEVEVVATEGGASDYHALDRLYALQSEERTERRGLETRAAATIAAALASIALSLNAVSSQISAAGVVAVVLLSTGAGLLALGLLATSVSLFGQSRFAVLVTRAVARLMPAVPLLTASVGIPDRERQSLISSLEQRRQARAGGDTATLREATRAVNLAMARVLARSVPGFSLPLDLALAVLDRRGASPRTRGADAAALGSSTASEVGYSLREPGNLDEAIDIADQEAQQLRSVNAATVVVLRWTSLMLGVGVVILAAGAVVLLVDAPVSAVP